MDLQGSMSGWGGAEDVFTVSSAEETSATIVDKRDDVQMKVESSLGDPRIRLSCDVAVSFPEGVSGDELVSIAGAVEVARAGTISCTFGADPTGFGVEAVVYEDGFGRHALNAAVLELRKTRQLLDARLRGLGEAARASEEVRKLMEEVAPAEEPAAQEVPPEATGEAAALSEEPAPSVAAAIPASLSATVVDSPAASAVQAAAAEPAVAEPAQPVVSSVESAGTRCSSCGTLTRDEDAFCPSCGTPRGAAISPAQPVVAQAVQAQPVVAQPAQPAPVEAAFAPGHSVPQGGMPAWAAPDPSAPSVAQLGAGLPLQVVEVRGAWAHVRASNAWEGWVDGRRLVPPVAS